MGPATKAAHYTAWIGRVNVLSDRSGRRTQDAGAGRCRRSMSPVDVADRWRGAPCGGSTGCAMVRPACPRAPWTAPQARLERCRSGRTGRSRKPLYARAYRGFESHPLRQVYAPSAPAPSASTGCRRRCPRSGIPGLIHPVLHQPPFSRGYDFGLKLLPIFED